ncbi:hypothetical protein [Comamonas odontotermitis]|uniref:hypothetical protein n=1 Tax=Comamonas odontotermitis TaxID=379895 RepID=UPI001CC33643|nr:hypothetical protein [Comamonas odontotermitis]UBB18345.1 hypothetical protein LAD35_06825 [Comamonas odontotermitis]
MAQLLDLRRKRFKPACAYVFDDNSWLFRVEADEWHSQPNRFDGSQLYAHIQIDEEDIPERIDFRPLTGLEVHLMGYRSDERTLRLYEAIKRVGPLILAAPTSTSVMIFKKETGDELHPNS